MTQRRPFRRYGVPASGVFAIQRGPKDGLGRLQRHMRWRFEPPVAPVQRSRTSCRRAHAQCGRNAKADFHRKKRSNEMHASTTDPHDQLCRNGPGKAAKLRSTKTGTRWRRRGSAVRSRLRLCRRDRSCRQEERLVGEHACSFGRDYTVYVRWHYVPVLPRRSGVLRIADRGKISGPRDLTCPRSGVHSD